MSETLPVARACDLDDKANSPRWLIGELWAASGVGVLGGCPKSYKSWLGLDMAVSVATATACLARFHVPAQGPALVFLAEDALHCVKERLVSLCAHRSLSLQALDVHVITAPTLRLDRSADIQRLDNTIAAIKPRLLLLDPLVRLHAGDENSSQEISRLLDSLRILQRKHELAIILVHHTRKSGGSRDGQTLRGSSDLWAFGDSNLFISQKDRHLVLSVEHRAAPAPEPMTIELAPDPPHLVIVDAADPPPSLESRLVELLSREDGPLSRTEIRRRLAVNNMRLGQAIESLIRSSIIVRSAKGLFLAPSPSPTPVPYQSTPPLRRNGTAPQGGRQSRVG